MQTLASVWNWLSSWITDRSFSTFLLGIITAWFVQRINNYWSKWRSIDETKLRIYMSWMPCFADWYVTANSQSATPPDLVAFEKKKCEILGTLQIMGPTDALLSLLVFSELAEMGFKKDPKFNKDEFHKSFTDLNYRLCCEIHGEKVKKRAQRRK